MLFWHPTFPSLYLEGAMQKYSPWRRSRSSLWQRDMLVSGGGQINSFMSHEEHRLSHTELKSHFLDVFLEV